MSNPLPDWHKRRVVLVDPATWRRYTLGDADLRPVYLDLVSALHDLGSRGRNAEPQCGPCGHLDSRLWLLPLVLDGGNLVHNGTVAIVTEEVLRDNPLFSRGEIEAAINSLGFERVVFIPNEPGDEIGHSDGMCRFLSKSTLLVNDYGISSMRSFSRQLRRVLHAAKLDVDLVPIPWFYRSGRSDGVPSAVGCYMNFLHLAQGIIVPAFDHHQDERARELLASLVNRPVVSINATLLAKLGGVFNCISLSL